jgi:predicted ATP-binding protein involved in virulence
MRVTEIAVKGLFGLFDHVIPLNLDDRITIIHGPNGVGKTVLLKMVHALLNGNREELKKIRFDTFSITLDNGDVRTFKSGFERCEREKNEGVPAKPTTKESHLSCYFVETQRLLTLGLNGKTNERTMVLSDFNDSRELFRTRLKVRDCSMKLAKLVQETLAGSAEKAQSLDRTFPARLLQSNGISVLPGSEIRNELKRIEIERARLVNIGLLDAADLEITSELPIDAQNEKVLSIYIHDTKEKLGVFEDLAARLDLLQRIINKRFLFKTLSINKEQGFVFTSDFNGPIPLEGLSSGEQHELVLLYELLFNTKPNSLILIDEPEISLHIAWQTNFLRDLQEISQLALLDVIIATHSPEIISDRWDLTVELKGPTK